MSCCAGRSRHETAQGAIARERHCHRIRRGIGDCCLRDSGQCLVLCGLGAVVRGVLALAMLLTTQAYAMPPEPGSEQANLMRGFKEWIEDQHSDDGTYCCTSSDGRVIFDNEIRRGSTTRWEIFYSSKSFSDGTDRWLAVPDGAILPQASPIGMPVAWVVNSKVYCLALGGQT